MVTTPATASTSGNVTASATTTANAGVLLNASIQSVSSKRLDESLWWDSFAALLDELDNAPHSSDLAANLVTKLKRNHVWFLDSVSLFKSPNEASRLALDSNEISLGVHSLSIRPKLKEAALRASKFLWLDEVQTYILVSRSFEHDESIALVEGQDFLQRVLLQYFIERQCLLKCIRCIFVNSLSVSNLAHSNEMKGEGLQLIHDGLEKKMTSVLQDMLSSAPSGKFDFLVVHDVELVSLWVDETVIEDIIILDILFLVYYENFCVCNAVQWKSLCSLFKDILGGVYIIEKMAVSVETRAIFIQAKAQLLFILIETLDLENLLRMVHDEVPIKKGGSMFSMQDIQEMDFLVSSFSGLGMQESGPLFLAWAVFICLLSSLPDINNNNTLMEIDHVDYARQAFDVGAFNYLLDILRSDSLRDLDGPISGFLSILRTFMSAFIASYENTQQPENTLSLILEILCEIYKGEESLSIQFWDRDSFVDGPIRSLLFLLESEYPFHILELIRLLLALCNGSWSAECVYNFLDKMHGMSLPFEFSSGSPHMDVYDLVEAHQNIPIPGVDGIFIPPGTRGHILKLIGVNMALVRWECAHSGVYLLVLHVAQVSLSSGHDEVFLILNLLYRLISSNAALCFNFLHLDESLFTQAARKQGLFEQSLRIDVVRAISLLAVRLIEEGGHANTVGICLSILAELLKCTPSHVIDMVLSSNIFGTTDAVSSSGSWLFSGGLSRMLLAEHEEESGCFLLTTSVLDFTIQLIQKGLPNTLVSSLIVFSLQYVFVNHKHMKCKFKYEHWKVTLKVLDVMKSCVKAVQNSHRLGSMIKDILYFDSSIHSSLCYFLYASKPAFENTSFSHGYGLKETEDLQVAVCSALDIAYSMLADLSKGSTLTTHPFVQTLLPASSKTVSIFTAALSLMSLFSNPNVQVAAAKVLSILCGVASRLQPYSLENITLADAAQISDLAAIVYCILEDETTRRNDLQIAILDLLVSAACFQPSLFVPMISTNVGGSGVTAGDLRNKLAQAPIDSRRSVIDSVLKYVERSELLISSDPRLLMSILNFLKSLWDGDVQYMDILDKVRKSAMFWEHLTSILSSRLNFDLPLEDMSDDIILSVAYRCRCQGIFLEIMSRELFLHEKLCQNEIFEKQASTNGSNRNVENRPVFEALLSSTKLLQSDILLSWHEGSVIDALLKSYSSGGYDIKCISHAKMAVCLIIVLLMRKLSDGNADFLSISLIEKIHIIQDKLRQNPSFSSLLVQYSAQGYSDGKEVTNLVLHDLYYQLQGELEGRMIAPGPFQELSGFLLTFETFQGKESTHEKDFESTDVILYDISSIRNELGIDLWDVVDWKETKETVEKLLSKIHEANLMLSLADSKIYAQKALIAIISLHGGKVLKSKSTLTSQGISASFLEKSITYVCKCLKSTEDSLAPALNHPSEKLLEILTTLAEMLFVLSKILFNEPSIENNKQKLFPVSIILIRTSGSCFKLLAAGRLSTMLNKAIKFLLMVLLMSMEFINPSAYINDDSSLDDNQLSEASLALIGIFPILCKYVENIECFDLSIASMDLMLKGFLAPNSWLPILQVNLHLKYLIQILRQRNSLASVTVTLNFLLTLAQTKVGAEMLHSINVFSSLKIFFCHLADDKSKPNGDCFPANYDNNGKHEHLLGLGFAIISSVIHSLYDDSSVVDIFDSTIHNFFADNTNMISSCLSIQNLQSDNQNKKTQNQDALVSLKALSLSEHSLLLICLLAKHREYRRKSMKELDLELRQKSIHLLAFISKEVQRARDPSNSTAPLFCLPALKEEAEFNEKPSFISSKHGWFIVSALRLSSKNKAANSLSQGLSLVTNDQPNGYAHAQPTYFSDVVAIQIYRIAFLLLTFLCIQAKAATERAEEVGYIDLARFPDLPMPEILHGLQDQAIAIIVDICEPKSSSIPAETEGVCLLMLQILEKSLYLEFCVTQSCGLRPVHGRVEDVAKEFKSLIQAVMQHKSLRPSLDSIRQIITLVYPGLVQSCSLV